MNSKTRTTSLVIPIDSLKNYIEPLLYTTGAIARDEEIVNLEIGSLTDGPPWETSTEIPLKFTVRKLKRVERTEVDGKGKGL